MAPSKATKRPARQLPKAELAAGEEPKKKTRFIKNKKPGELYITNVRMPKEMHVDLKYYAQTHKKTLIELFDSVIEDFMKRESSKEVTMYKGESTEAELRSFWVTGRVVKMAEAFAKQDGVTTRRLYDTALYLFWRDTIKRSP